MCACVCACSSFTLLFWFSMSLFISQNSFYFSRLYLTISMNYIPVYGVCICLRACVFMSVSVFSKYYSNAQNKKKNYR